MARGIIDVEIAKTVVMAARDLGLQRANTVAIRFSHSILNRLGAKHVQEYRSAWQLRSNRCSHN